uniref:ribosomal protein L32 n=1 Tax=Polulichloris maxima TaxID=2704661 RepID=UPI0024116AFD|nr:ribosomal protein L32 [Polulichloris maxima]WDY13276.1 ribosomal protein L32 [Polulichloris maxima]
MAVPKKRTSKAKKNMRKASWKKKASEESKKAISLAFSAISRRESDKKTINEK